MGLWYCAGAVGGIWVSEDPAKLLHWVLCFLSQNVPHTGFIMQCGAALAINHHVPSVLGLGGPNMTCQLSLHAGIYDRTIPKALVRLCR